MTAPMANSTPVDPSPLALSVEEEKKPPAELVIGDIVEGVDNSLSLKVDVQDTDDVEGVRQRFSVERSIFNQPDLDDDYDGGPRKLKSVKERLQLVRDRWRFSGPCFGKWIISFLPFIGIMKNYNPKRDLIGDIMAGLTVGVMQIPQGMAYAVLASVDAVYGLYMSFFPIIVYFFFGTSRHLSFGTFAVISLMVGSAVDRLCTEEDTRVPDQFVMEGLDINGTNGTGGGIDAACAIGVATALTILGGFVQIGMGILQLGFVVIYLSEPMTRGFTTGCSIHVFSSQIKSLFGVSIPRHNGAFKLIYTYRDLILALPQTNPAAIIASVVCAGVIFLTKEYLEPPVKKRIKAPIPIDLIIVVLGTVASYYGNFEEKYDLEVVGEIPTGIPVPQVPPANRFTDVIVDAIVVSVVSYAISISMAQLFAKRNGYTVDANQELLAHGITNVVCSNFHCYLMSVSLSRSLVQENVGGVTQIAGLIASLLILVVLLALASLFEALPNCILAAIIVVALKGMFMQLLDLKKLWKISKTDMSVWLVTFLAVVLLDIDLGLMVGVAWSFLTVIGRTQRPYTTVLGRVGDTDMYADTRAYDKAEELPGIKIIRFENSVYFANREYFVNRVYHKSGCNPKDLALAQKKAKSRQRKAEAKSCLAVEEQYPIPKAPIHHVILDCSTMGYLDSMGVSGVSTIINDYKAVDVSVYLAACKPGVHELLEDAGFHEKIPKSVLYPTIHDAVLQALKHKPLQQELLHIGSSENGSPPSYHSPTASTEPSPDNSVLQNGPDAVGLDNKAFVPDTQEQERRNSTKL